jgi:uncharacterized protein
MVNSLKKILKQTILMTFFTLNALSAQAENGLFWKAESSKGNTIYLFGTIHSDDNRVTAFTPETFDAINASDAFMMETLSPNDQSALMTPVSLSESLTSEELDKVNALAEFHVMHREATMHMKPWLLAVIFDSPRPLTPFAQDNLLMRKAEDSGKEVIGIEDTQEHFGVMDQFSRAEQLVMLKAVLNRTQETKEQDFEKLMAAYLEGNSEKILNLDAKITGGMLPPEIWAKMKMKLIDDRNQLMAERIIEEAKAKKVFVAVGASHLAGQNGLMNQLKSAGYELSPVQ